MLIKKVFIFIILLSSEVSSFELDGMISDSEWDDAQKFDNFNTVYPFSLNKLQKKQRPIFFLIKKEYSLALRTINPQNL